MFGTHGLLQVWTSNPFLGCEILTLTSYGILGAFAYSIKTEGNIIKHVKINKNNNKFQLDQPDENGTGVAKQFDSLEELVDHYKEYGMVDTATSLIRPDTPGQNSHMGPFRILPVILVPTSGILAEHIYQRNTVLASGKGSTGYSEEFLELQQFEGKRIT